MFTVIHKYFNQFPPAHCLGYIDASHAYNTLCSIQLSSSEYHSGRTITDEHNDAQRHTNIRFGCKEPI